MTEKTSPYIFPFTPFRHLDAEEPNISFTAPSQWSAEQLVTLLERFAPELAPPTDGSVAERILGIFTLPDVLFGEHAFIESCRAEWLARIDALIRKGQRIDFTILGFPFKMPVPLKTKRKCADFGELVSLSRLARIADAVGKIYQPGAAIHVFTEGPFGTFNGVDRSQADEYVVSLRNLIERFSLEGKVVIHDLNVVVDETPEFLPVWKQVTEELRAKRDQGDPVVLKALSDALPVRFHNLANPGVDDDELRRAYLGDGSAESLRQSIQQRAEEGVLHYRAFLDARDRIDLLGKYVPDALPMTVSPRAGRLGVRPLPAPANILPYHGVPVIAEGETQLRIEYLWDLLCSGKTVKPVTFVEDRDQEPFLYVEV